MSDASIITTTTGILITVTVILPMIQHHLQNPIDLCGVLNTVVVAVALVGVTSTTICAVMEGGEDIAMHAVCPVVEVVVAIDSVVIIILFFWRRGSCYTGADSRTCCQCRRRN